MFVKQKGFAVTASCYFLMLGGWEGFETYAMNHSQHFVLLKREYYF